MQAVLGGWRLAVGPTLFSAGWLPFPKTLARKKPGAPMQVRFHDLLEDSLRRKRKGG